MTADCDRPIRCAPCSAKAGHDVFRPAWQFYDSDLRVSRFICRACKRERNQAAYAKAKTGRAAQRAANTALMRRDLFYTGPTGPALVSIRTAYRTTEEIE